MHAVMRTYSGPGAAKLMDLLEQHKDEVEEQLRSVQGFVSYVLARSTEGGFSVSVYQDKTGTAGSMRVARDWIAQHGSNTGVKPPTVVEGTVILQAD
jgi:hypothetical protein